jgi:hypothetical protein
MIVVNNPYANGSHVMTCLSLQPWLDVAPDRCLIQGVSTVGHSGVDEEWANRCVATPHPLHNREVPAVLVQFKHTSQRVVVYDVLYFVLPDVVQLRTTIRGYLSTHWWDITGGISWQWSHGLVCITFTYYLHEGLGVLSGCQGCMGRWSCTFKGCGDGWVGLVGSSL